MTFTSVTVVFPVDYEERKEYLDADMISTTSMDMDMITITSLCF